MPLPVVRPLNVSCALAMLALLAGAVGCRDNGKVTISGDVAGLDTLGLIGDSLFARAGASASTMDSLRIATAGGRSRKATVAPGDSRVPETRAGPPTNAMTARAQARGDSMARAQAMKASGKTPSGRVHDTVRGVVTLVGMDQAKQVVLRADNGATTIAMSGMATTGLAKLAGAELVVRGVKITPRDFVVTDFIVRAVDGVPVIDGRLDGGTGGYWLDLSDGSGRRRLSSLPAALQGLQGSRVWLVVGPGAAPSRSYGVIGRR